MKKKSNKVIVIAGSEGLLGKVISKALESEYEILKLDLSLGHDVTNENTLIDIFSSSSNLYGLINLFCINPQPNTRSKTLEEIQSLEIREYLEVNVVALFSICKQFSKYCMDQSSVINFGSIHGNLSPKHFIYNKGFTKHIGYTISKSAVSGLSKYFATYFAGKIRFNTIVPGGVENGQEIDFIEQYSKMTPLQRMMKPDEIISSVKFLLSPKSSYVTGSEVTVDGGWSAW